KRMYAPDSFFFKSCNFTMGSPFSSTRFGKSVCAVARFTLQALTAQAKTTTRDPIIVLFILLLFIGIKSIKNNLYLQCLLIFHSAVVVRESAVGFFALGRFILYTKTVGERQVDTTSMPAHGLISCSGRQITYYTRLPVIEQVPNVQRHGSLSF